MRIDFDRALVAFALVAGLGVSAAQAAGSDHKAAAQSDIAQTCGPAFKLGDQRNCAGALLQELTQSAKDIASIQEALPQGERSDFIKYQQQDDNCAAAMTETALLSAFYQASAAGAALPPVADFKGSMEATAHTRAACLQGLSAYLKTMHPEGATLVASIGQRLSAAADKIAQAPAAKP